MLTFKLESTKPKYNVFTSYLHDVPVLVREDDGLHRAKFTGVVWRISMDNECFNAWWPSKKAAEMFIDEMESFKWTLQ